MEYKSYSTIVTEKLKLDEHLTYYDELTSTEWQEKRLEIISRDSNICTNCKAQATTLLNRFPRREKTEKEVLEYKERMRKAWDELKVTWQGFGIPLHSFPKFNENIEIPLEYADKHIILHVHHKYYIKQKKAWEYQNDALITLCSTCHQEEHNQNSIPVYSNDYMTEKLNLTDCPKCKGSGYLGEYHYYKDGICFACNGYKYSELIQY